MKGMHLKSKIAQLELSDLFFSKESLTRCPVSYETRHSS
jgi:hypothetical protein